MGRGRGLNVSSFPHSIYYTSSPGQSSSFLFNVKSLQRHIATDNEKIFVEKIKKTTTL